MSEREAVDGLTSLDDDLLATFGPGSTRRDSLWMSSTTIWDMTMYTEQQVGTGGRVSRGGEKAQ